MKLGTRLLVTLLPTTAVVMTLYAAWALREREAAIVPEAQEETQAYATALALAVGQAYGDLENGALQEIIDEISAQPKIYAVVVYDSTGQALYASPLLAGRIPTSVERLGLVLATATADSFEHRIGNRRVFSVLQPLVSEAGTVRGVLEVAEPLDVVATERARIQRRFILNTVTLLVVLGGITLWLVQRAVARPMQRFVSVVQALGGGELGQRVPEQMKGSELAELAGAFNRMASNLQQARADLVAQAEERLALERNLRQTEQMAVVGRLAAGLAHEIAAPLNVISGRAEMLLRSGQYPAGQERNLRIIIDEIGRITSIVRNLLDFSRRPAVHRAPLDLVELVRGAVEFLDPEFQRAGIAVAMDAPASVPMEADGDQLHRVFVNLLLNAKQAMEAVEGRRSIVVRIGTSDHGSENAAPGPVTVEIEDTGPGIPQEVLGKLFKPFFTTKPRGTGLGLMVARSVTEDHGGAIEAENRSDGSGAVFRVTLPRVDEGLTADV
jgi:two-component system NtrC family sensor kinase